MYNKVFNISGVAARLLENTVEGVIVTDGEQKILMVNRAFTKVTGYEADEVLGQDPRLLQSGRHETAFFQEMWDSIRTKGEWEGEIWNRRKNGEIYPEWLRVIAIRGEGGELLHYAGFFTDISAHKEVEKRLSFLSRHDILTELPNRSMFYDRLEHAIAQSLRKGNPVAILVINLDRFKIINESLGHSMGDALLCEVARRLTENLRIEDTVARLGGDEFGILLDDLRMHRDITVVVQKVMDVLSRPFYLAAKEVFVTPSMGISLFPEDGSGANILLQNADTALHRAKEQGKNRFQFYRNEMNSRASERLTMENSLRYALLREEFTLHYQPQIDPNTGEMAGMEALLRWNHPGEGILYPGKFIRIAEEAGLIVSIGEWVLRAVCMQAKEWQSRGIPHPRISFNFSASQFRIENLADYMLNRITELGVDPHSLEMEITESMAMDNFEYSIDLLRRINEMGLTIAIDDFGTGYSSLAYLKRFSIQRIKIDGSFIRDIGKNRDSEAIIETMILLGRSMKLQVVAEGVETRDQLNFLMRHGCDLIQGYLYSTPIPADQMEILLKENKRFFL